MNLLQDIKNDLSRLLNLEEDAAPEKEVVEGIHAGIDFRGAKLWILVLAIFVASLGLNTNSTAVIIGAMLISPLMGPIIGMGLSIGINDFETFKRSLRSLAVATLFSVATATIYWLITPMAENQSELLARTAPTIWDVLIALTGGMAGIIALTSASQRTGNVIPGVAIATALMPPLCTVGFGLATAQWLYALGAFYLYTINVTFITIATFLGVRLMRFHHKVFVDKKRELKVRRTIYAIVIVTMIPACIITYGMIKKTLWLNNAMAFVDKELQFKGTQIIAKHLNYDEKNIQVVVIGNEVTAADTAVANRRLPDYKLSTTTLNVVQGNSSMDMQELRGMLGSAEKETTHMAQLINEQKRQIQDLQNQLAPYDSTNTQAAAIADEMQALFPEVDRLSLGRSVVVHLPDTTAHDTLTTAILHVPGKMKPEDQERLNKWLSARLSDKRLQVIISKDK